MAVIFIKKSSLGVQRKPSPKPVATPNPAPVPKPPPALQEPSYDELAALGCVPEYQPYAALKPINRPHFKNGEQVRLVAEDGPWRYICKTGDVGNVLNILPSLKGETDDVYKVQMPNSVAYLLYTELARCSGVS